MVQFRYHYATVSLSHDNMPVYGKEVGLVTHAIGAHNTSAHMRYATATTRAHNNTRANTLGMHNHTRTNAVGAHSHTRKHVVGTEKCASTHRKASFGARISRPSCAVLVQSISIFLPTRSFSSSAPLLDLPILSLLTRFLSLFSLSHILSLYGLLASVFLSFPFTHLLPLHLFLSPSLLLPGFPSG